MNLAYHTFKHNINKFHMHLIWWFWLILIFISIFKDRWFQLKKTVDMTHFRLYHNLNTKCRLKTLYRIRWTNFRKTLSFKSSLDRFNFKRYEPNNARVLKYDTPRTSAILVATDPQYPTVRFFQTHLPPTVNQPLYSQSPIPPVTVASVLNQQRQLTQHLSTFPK